MTDDEKLNLLAEFAAAWAAADVDQLMTLMTDDCVYAASVGPEPGTTYSGYEAVRQGFAEILEFESGGEARSGRTWLCGDTAFAEWSYDEVDANGNVTNIRGIDIFEFEGYKLKLKDAYRKTRVES